MRILNELRPAAEGFAGIPQETRILHSVFARHPDTDVVGLLNGNTMPMPGAIARQSRSVRDRVYFEARTVLELSDSADGSIFDAIFRRYRKARGLASLKTQSIFGPGLKVYELNMREYSDFVWRSYFSKTLPASDREWISALPYAGIIPPWALMQGVAMLRPFVGRYIRMNTSKYDVMISQTPWPARISSSTQLVIRYHDAIPMFYPHTIHNAVKHQFTHYFPLKSNLQSGAKVVCNSENSRTELLKLFPDKEKATHVIPCAVSNVYFPEKEPQSRQVVRDIIKRNIEPDTAPKFRSSQEAQMFYDRHLSGDDLKYIMMVSTIEPRKNHSRLIAAWSALQATAYPNLKLVIVGRPGWHVESLLESMQGPQSMGQIFNISRVGAPDLRRLYRGAEAVVCPSIAEGFDLSGIEAMLSGGLVAASDISVHREIYKDASVYFDPYSTSSTVEAINALMQVGNSDLRQRLKSRGQEVGREYATDRIEPMWHDYLDGLRR